MRNRYATLALLIAALLWIFLGRTLLAGHFPVPPTFHLFDTFTVAGSIWILLRGYRNLLRQDLILALVLGAGIGMGMMFATLFSPYPFLVVVRSDAGQAGVRGMLTFIAALGGLAIMHQGGPLQFHAANGNRGDMSRGILVGLAIGLPLAVVNVFALQFTQGQPIRWQNLLAALLDALQPGVVEEIVYRFALWGCSGGYCGLRFPNRQSGWLTGNAGT